MAAEIARVGAAKLRHEVRDDAVEVHAVVEAALSQVDPVTGGDRHLVHKELDREAARTPSVQRRAADAVRVAARRRGKRESIATIELCKFEDKAGTIPRIAVLTHGRAQED
eukprot:scaffold31608_cov63-Phaeocystis_antarctica.AAC.11